MIRRSQLLLVALALAVAGCGDAESVTVDPPADATPPLKAILTDIAASGQPLGSGAETVRTEIEALKATDAAKGDELLKDLAELEQLQDPAAIKAKAQAMADKL